MTDEHIAHLRQLSQWLAGTDISLLELSGPDRVIRLRRDEAGPGAAVQAAASPAAAAPPAGTVVRAASVGIALLSHPLRTEPLVRVGQAVRAGQTLALLKIGLVLLPVTAPCGGTVLRIVAAHEARVGWGAPLLELREE